MRWIISTAKRELVHDMSTSVVLVAVDMLRLDLVSRWSVLTALIRSVPCGAVRLEVLIILVVLIKILVIDLSWIVAILINGC